MVLFEVFFGRLYVNYNMICLFSCQILDWLAGLLLLAIQHALMLQEPLGEYLISQSSFSPIFKVILELEYVMYDSLCGSYLAPEYFMYGKVSDKVDVFAFGVVLLELLSGRKPINSEHPKGQESLVMWVWSLVYLFNQNRRISSNDMVFVFLNINGEKDYLKILAIPSSQDNLCTKKMQRRL